MMASIMDLILRVMGNSGQFREDMEQDKVVLEDFVNSIHDLNIDVNLEDADAKAKLDAFRADLEKVRNAHADIDIDDADAKMKVDEIRLKLDEIRTASAKIDIHDEDAKLKIDEIKLKLDEIKNESARIKIDDKDAKAKLDDLKAKMDELHQKSVDVEINDADAKVKLDDIKMKLDDIRDAHSKIDVDDERALLQIDELDRKLDRLEARIETINHTPVKPKVDEKGAAGEAGAGAGLLVGSILSVLPAISPLAAVATAAIGSLGGAFTAATAGAVGFGVIARGVFKDVQSQAANVTKAQQGVAAAQQNVNKASEQLKAAKTYQQWLVASENLTKAQQGLAQATKAADQAQASQGTTITNFETTLDGFKSYWSSYVKSFESPVLVAFTLGLQGAQKVLELMQPVIRNAAGAIDQLLREFDHDLGGSASVSFFKTLAQTTGPAILAFGRSAANIFSGLGGIFKAFAPTFGGVENGLVSLTARFAAWGQQLGSSNSFRQFLEYVRKEAPQVMSLIGNLSTTVVKLLEAMAPGGAVVIAVVNSILKLVNALLSVNPLIGEVGVAIMQGIGVMKLLAPVISGVITAIRFFAVSFLGASEEVGAAIMGLSGPIGWIIAAVVAAVILIVTHWKQISKEAQKLWKDVSNFFSQLATDIQKIWNKFLKWLDTLWNRIVSFFKKWGPEVLTLLVPFMGIPLVIAQHYRQIIGWLESVWKKVVSGIKTFGSNAISEVKKIGQEIGDYFANLAHEAVQWGSNIIHSMAQGITNAIGAVRSAVSNVASNISHFLGFHSPAKEGPGSDADRWMPNLMSMMVEGVNAGIPKVRAALSQVMIPPNSASMIRMSGEFANAEGGSLVVHYNQNAPVYGVDDLNDAISSGVQAGIDRFKKSVKKTARGMGVSN